MEKTEHNYFSSNKPFDELTPEEQEERIKESASADGFSEDDAQYMAHMWRNF